ncbi:hypothetical protein Anapl_08059 [Anas platyrhynchos]|uniref:Uncharacterized protein n=1 Tax=Anas platyrhynchos TaxID=8839 RepID=R0M8L8_ANAPL|nr:hypothetical protein Anapl_08059 [Anas platyrhynchos]
MRALFYRLWVERPLIGRWLRKVSHAKAAEMCPEPYRLFIEHQINQMSLPLLLRQTTKRVTARGKGANHDKYETMSVVKESNLWLLWFGTQLVACKTRGFCADLKATFKLIVEYSVNLMHYVTHVEVYSVCCTTAASSFAFREADQYLCAASQRELSPPLLHVKESPPKLNLIDAPGKHKSGNSRLQEIIMNVMAEVISMPDLEENVRLPSCEDDTGISVPILTACPVLLCLFLKPNYSQYQSNLLRLKANGEGGQKFSKMSRTCLPRAVLEDQDGEEIFTFKEDQDGEETLLCVYHRCLASSWGYSKQPVPSAVSSTALFCVLSMQCQAPQCPLPGIALPAASGMAPPGVNPDAGNSQEIGFAAAVSLQNAGEGGKSMVAIRNLVLLSARSLFLIKPEVLGAMQEKGHIFHVSGLTVGSRASEHLSPGHERAEAQCCKYAEPHCKLNAVNTRCHTVECVSLNKNTVIMLCFTEMIFIKEGCISISSRTEEP